MTKFVDCRPSALEACLDDNVRRINQAAEVQSGLPETNSDYEDLEWDKALTRLGQVEGVA